MNTNFTPEDGRLPSGETPHRQPGLGPTPDELRLSIAIDSGEAAAATYFERGKLRWKRGDRAGAITDYETAADLDPASPAVQALSMTRDIMNFFNPDIYNP